jgi:hypothetical protein
VAENKSQFIVETTRDVILAMIRGDLLLRQESLDGLNASTILPTIFFAREMRGKLSFVVKVSESEKFLFGLFKEEREESVADLRINFALAPSVETASAGREQLSVMFAPPPFLMPAADPDQLSLLLYNDDLLFVAFTPTNRATLRLQNGRVLPASASWPVSIGVELLKTLAAWNRSGKTGAPQPYNISETSILGNLLQKIVEGHHLITDELTEKPSDNNIVTADRQLSKIHPELGGGYRLSSMQARLLVQLDQNGEVLSDLEDPNWHQIDIVIRITPVGGGYEISLAINPPDILVNGPYHRTFLSAIREMKTRERLHDRLKDTLPITAEAFRDYLNDPVHDQRAVFARIDRNDLDLVLLEGTIEGQSVQLLYEIKFKVTAYPMVEVTDVSDIQLLGTQTGSNEWTGTFSKREAGRLYFERFFRILRIWQAGISFEGVK